MTAVAFAAKYSGTCADCGSRINVGDAIQFNADDEVEHVGCPTGPLDLKPSDVVCTECWLVKPCECDA